MTAKKQRVDDGSDDKSDKGAGVDGREEQTTADANAGILHCVQDDDKNRCVQDDDKNRCVQDDDKTGAFGRRPRRVESILS
jgi:hypothetical protein